MREPFVERLGASMRGFLARRDHGVSIRAEPLSAMASVRFNVADAGAKRGGGSEGAAMVMRKASLQVEAMRRPPSCWSRPDCDK